MTFTIRQFKFRMYAKYLILSRLWREILQIYSNQTDKYRKIWKDLRDFCRKATLIITNIELAIAYILHPFNATDGKESFAFCEGATLLAKLGSFAVGGRESYPDQCNDTPPRRIGEAGKLRLLSQGDLRILRRCNLLYSRCCCLLAMCLFWKLADIQQFYCSFRCPFSLFWRQIIAIF